MKRSVLFGVVSLFVLFIVAPTAAFACVTASWIATDPGSGPPGTKVTVTGAGFEPGTVLFRWDASAESGGEVLGEAVVGDDGRVVAEITVPDAPAGAHKVVAEHTSSSETVAHADAWADFHVPDAAAGEGSRGESGQGESGERSSTASVSGPATTKPGAAEPATTSTPQSNVDRPAQPMSDSHLARGSGEADQAQTEVSEPRRLPQLADRLRALDAATYPVVMDGAVPDAEQPSTSPATPEPAASDLRWFAVAVAAMAVGLFLVGRRARWRTAEPEAALLEVPAVQASEEERRQAA